MVSSFNKSKLKFVFITLFFNILFSTSFAQLNFKWLNEEKTIEFDNLESMRIIKENNAKILYTTAFNGNSLGFYDKIHNKNEFIFDKDQNIPLSSVCYLDLNDTIINISCEIDYNNKKVIVIANSINENQMKYNNDSKIISEIDFSKTKEFNFNRVTCTAKKQCEKILITYKYETISNNILYQANSLLYGFEVFDKNLNKVWGVNKDFDNLSDLGFHERNYILDNLGNVYASHEYSENKNNKNKPDNANSKFFLVYYPQNGSTIKHIETRLENEYHSINQQIAVNKNNDLICIGFFAPNGQKNVIGTFSKVYKNGLTDLQNSSFKQFDVKLMTKGLDEKTSAYVSKMISLGKDYEKYFTLDLSNIRFHENGDFDLIAEKKKLLIVKTTDAGYNVFDYEYTYDDLFLLRFDNSANLIWSKRIPKNQYLVNSNNMVGSYYSYLENDNINVLFNIANSHGSDNNLNEKSKTYLISIDKKGSETFHEISNDYKFSNTFCPMYTFDSKNGKFTVVRVLREKRGFFSGPWTINHTRIIFGEF